VFAARSLVTRPAREGPGSCGRGRSPCGGSSAGPRAARPNDVRDHRAEQDVRAGGRLPIRTAVVPFVLDPRMGQDDKGRRAHRAGKPCSTGWRTPYCGQVLTGDDGHREIRAVRVRAHTAFFWPATIRFSEKQGGRRTSDHLCGVGGRKTAADRFLTEQPELRADSGRWRAAQEGRALVVEWHAPKWSEASS